ncbi:probable aminopeptidase [Plesiocystis pacifica SIR-1]|uniref:Probable aminopeptidase n=1 Tax=Plesiocystis pacifica SIR-1 TaxID=391625 RepID=A6G5H1_9BACT|nr:probable aminopeptidase [Plesiocystis pacifica SIR-1]
MTDTGAAKLSGDGGMDAMLPRAAAWYPQQVLTRVSSLALVAALALSLGCDRGAADAKESRPPAPSTEEREPPGPGLLEIDADAMLDGITWLASDERRGRYTFSPEIQDSALWVRQRYEALGLSPVGAQMIHPFQMRTAVTAGETQRLVIHSGARAREAKADEFTPIAFGRPGKVRGELVFAGYATRWDRERQLSYFRRLRGHERVDLERAPDGVYDDLDGVDLDGKIALVLMHAPRRSDLRGLYVEIRDAVQDFEFDAGPLLEAGDVKALEALHRQTRERIVELAETSIELDALDAAFWSVPDPRAGIDVEILYAHLLDCAITTPQFVPEHNRLEEKLERLRDAGAIGAVVVNGPRSFMTPDAREADALRELPAKGSGLGVVRVHAPFPVVQLRWRAADRLLRIDGRKLSKIQAKIDRELEPRSGPLGVEVELEVELDEDFTESPNVLAMIPGRSEDIVLVGAHLDHIGVKGEGHCRPRGAGADLICNGADDNASGTAVVMDIARSLAASGESFERTVVFAHFSGEELGLFGSKALVADPPFPLERVVAMINLDMVGRLRDGALTISGLDSSETWLPLLDELGVDERAEQLLLDRHTTTRSDHAPFFRRQIPSLFFFTGTHEDYHQPSDETARIDREGLAIVGQLALDVVVALARGRAIRWGELEPGEGIGYGLTGADSPTLIER